MRTRVYERDEVALSDAGIASNVRVYMTKVTSDSAVASDLASPFPSIAPNIVKFGHLRVHSGRPLAPSGRPVSSR